MYIVDVNELEVGMVVAKNIYNAEGVSLINNGFELNERTIERIKMLDYDKLWIKDEFEIFTDYLSEELKIKAVRSIKSFFTGFASKKGALDMKKIDDLQNVVQDVVEEIIKNKNCFVQLSNLRNFNNGLYEHSVDVARVAVLIGANLEGLKKDKLVNLCLAAMLHDIGKTEVDSFNKNIQPTDEEIGEMKRHPNLGYRIVKETGRFDAQVYVPVFQHHERYDGKGYPDHMAGEKINIFARIIRIADTYCNMRTGTTTSKAYIQSEVLEYFYADGSRQFDPEILKVFLSKVPVYEVGQKIKLSDGKHAFVIQNNENALARPIVRILGENKTLGAEVDLFKNSNITIIS